MFVPQFRFRRLALLILPAILWAAQVSGATIQIVRYTAPPGESAWVDERWDSFSGLGQLTDGQVGADDWSADLGNGSGYEWVGWASINPIVTLDLGFVHRLDALRLHLNNYGSGGVGLPSVSIQSSQDGLFWQLQPNYQQWFRPEDRLDPSARLLDYSLSGTARHIRFQLFDRPGVYNFDNPSASLSYPWIFLSEVQVTGEAIPEPSSYVLLVGGLIFVFSRYRRLC